MRSHASAPGLMTEPARHPWLDHLRYFGQWIVLGLALAFLVTAVWPGWRSAAPPPPAAPASYADAVKRAGPAVVNIYTNRLISESRTGDARNPLIQRFLGNSPNTPPQQRLEQILGSAVIVSADGYLLTNHHVVAGRGNNQSVLWDDIRAVLWDGRVAQARIIGSDPDSDLAVLKIDVTDLPHAVLAPEQSLKIGDVVLAIGNPFGLGQSVTMGIVSALGQERVNLGIAGYEFLVQTDAAVNTGNSGGALVNAAGELVGINTLMYAGAEGISFAVPVETAKVIMEQIIRQGFVTRGWMGVELSPAQLDNVMTGERRVALQVVGMDDSISADSSQLRLGDILMSFDGEKITSLQRLRFREARLAPGSSVRVAGLRAGVPFEADVVLVQKPVPPRGGPVTEAQP